MAHRGMGVKNEAPSPNVILGFTPRFLIHQELRSLGTMDPRDKPDLYLARL